MAGQIVIHFHKLEKKSVRGLVISNSCDVDERNTPRADASVFVLSIIPVADYQVTSPARN